MSWLIGNLVLEFMDQLLEFGHIFLMLKLDCNPLAFN